MKTLFFLSAFLIMCSSSYAQVKPMGIREWNISSDIFNTLGDVIETTTIDGLTIYAKKGTKGIKVVLYQENGKVKYYSLVLDSCGIFDENGQPLHRVLSFEVTGNTKISVTAMSSFSDINSILYLAAGHKDSIFAQFSLTGAYWTTGTYNYIGEANKVFLYSPIIGAMINFIKAEPELTEVNKIYTENIEVNVYPNPATDKIYIDYSKPILVAVYDITGSLMKSQMIHSKYNFISISDLQPGMYFICSQNDIHFAKKLIKR